MPKQVVTQEMILNSAMEIMRERGFESVNARSVADFMGRSVQPIYSYFQNMDELKDALYIKAKEFYDSFIQANADMSSLESMGEANIKFAKQETNLFRLLFLTKLNFFHSFSDIYRKMGIESVADSIATEYDMSYEEASDIYVMMIVFTHGIATMLATGAAQIKDEEVCGMLKEAFKSFVGRKSKK